MDEEVMLFINQQFRDKRTDLVYTFYKYLDHIIYLTNGEHELICYDYILFNDFDLLTEST